MRPAVDRRIMRANLKAAIEVRFGSQIAFAREVHLHSVKINRLCRGWIEPTARERARIAEALQADADWLFAALLIPAPKNTLPESQSVVASSSANLAI